MRAGEESSGGVAGAGHGTSVVWLAGSRVSPRALLILYASFVPTMAALLSRSTAERLVLLGALAVCLGLFCRCLMVEGILLDPDGLTIRRMFSRQRVRWSEVVAVRMLWESTKGGFGNTVMLVRGGGPGGVEDSIPWLGRRAPDQFIEFTRRHALDVPLNPPELWCDRLGVWHGPLLEFDPLESIRSIRRAAVGPFLISIRPTEDGFRVVTTDQRTGAVQRTSEPLASLAEATDEGIRQVNTALPD